MVWDIDLTHRRPRYVGWQVAVALAILISGMVGVLASARVRVLAQEEESWRTPTNLSLSGAASAPVVVTGTEGRLRVFWWDGFSGVTMVDGELGSWAAPRPAPIVVIEPLERPAADGREFDEIPLGQMPHIVGDSSGVAHALWLWGEDEDTGGRPLFYARMGAGETEWSRPRSLAESASSFKLVGDSNGVLHLVYIRDTDNTDGAAGLYYRRSSDGGGTWGQGVPIDTSRYYRLVTSDVADIDVTAEGDGSIFVTWRDPYLSQVMLTASTDGGESWHTPVIVGPSANRSQNGRFVSTVDSTEEQTWLQWEDTGDGLDCVIRQALVEAVLVGTMGNSVLSSLATCSTTESNTAVRFLTLDAARALIVASEGYGSVTTALWDGEQWSEPERLRLDFIHPQKQIPVYLSDLDVGLAPEPGAEATSPSGEMVLYFVGTDESGDVWLVTRDLATLQVVFAEPSPWSAPVALSQGLTSPRYPAVIADPEGRVHVLWSQSQSADELRYVLWYARWQQDRWSRPTMVLDSPEGGARDPALVLSDNYVHAVWSGGPNGVIWHSYASIRDAYAVSEWLEPRVLSSADVPTSADMGKSPTLVTADGRLHVVYAVPVNEGRGIYHRSSDDEGESWSDPHVIFDADEAGWSMVDLPQLAVDLQGGLHVLWLRPTLPEDEPAHGIYYAASTDGGETWSAPLTVADGAYAWPRITVNGLNQVHLVWQDGDEGRVWWHRWLPNAATQTEADVEWEGWSRVQQLSGTRGVEGPIAMLADGEGTVHWLGLDPEEDAAPILIHLQWKDERWEEQESLTLQQEFRAGEVGVAAALSPELGHLDVLFAGEVVMSEATPQAELWHSGRRVPSAAPFHVASLDSLATPTPLATSTPNQLVTPTPDLRAGPDPVARSSTLSLMTSLLIAGGLAAVVLIGFVGARWFGIVPK